METIHEYLSKAKGLILWDAVVSHGSSVFFEFGDPALRIREPETQVALESILRRRRVRAIGEFELLTRDCFWEINCKANTINQFSDLSNFQSIFENMKGEILSEIIFNDDLIVLEFDLGSKIKLSKNLDLSEKYVMFTLTIDYDHIVDYMSSGVCL